MVLDMVGGDKGVADDARDDELGRGITAVIDLFRLS